MGNGIYYIFSVTTKALQVSNLIFLAASKNVIAILYKQSIKFLFKKGPVSSLQRHQ